MGIVSTVLFAVLFAGAVIALAPVTRPPLSNYSFMIGFVAGELAGQYAALTLVLMGVFSALGWPHGALGTASLVLGVLSVASYAVLWVGGLRATGVVRHALAEARGVDLLHAVGEAPQWLAWWRTCLGFAIRGSSIRVQRDIAYVEDGTKAHRLDVITPASGTTGAPVMLYVHGGAWTIGSKRDQALPMLYELAARGWVCVTINYRLSPKATWPDHIVDVKRAIAWTRANVADYGGDAGRFLAISGGSAGGHLAALAALTPGDKQWQPEFEDVDTRVDACVSLYGVLEMTGDPAVSGHLGRGLRTLLERTVMKVPLDSNRAVFEEASPLHRLTEGAPAFLVLQGTKDTLVHVEVARAFVEAFRAATTAPLAYVELPGAQHAFDLLCSPRCTATTLGIASYLEALVLARSAKPTR